MKPFVLITIALVAVAAVGYLLLMRSRMGGGVQRVQAGASAGSFYDFKTRTLEGEPASLSEHRGKVALVVNVASKCGLTPQYEGLEALQDELAASGFTVLGFPSNDFMGQEPGSPEEIRTFCSTTYGISFPLYEKRTVKGDGKDEVYRFLTRQLEEPTWNFTKYLIDREGNVIARFAPKTTPDDPELRRAIEEALAAGAASAGGR